jgi:uncharacterized protein (DUF3084 family)
MKKTVTKTREQIEAEEEAKAQEAERKRIEKQKKEKARDDYNSRLHRVYQLKEMTDTKAWQEYYSKIQRLKEQAAKDVLTAEKTRDIIKFQEMVKILDGTVTGVQGPVEELNRYCHDMPLFAAEFMVRANWNKGLGMVELTGK